MSTQKLENHVVVKNDLYIQKAESLKPELKSSVVKPERVVEVNPDPTIMHGWKVEPVSSIDALYGQEFKKGDSFVVDFGDHQVGYVTFRVRPVGSPPDAPLKLKLTIGEMPVEMGEPFENYDGWLSSAWLQEETIFVDVLPATIPLPRRYSFRYVKFEVLATSQKYQVMFEDIECRAVTSADLEAVEVLGHSDHMLQKIDEVSIKTLADCMQDVFEDGPKRDRRLWLGDLRLQALANYETFGTNELVKRCLYLFAGVPNDQGKVSANVFIEPQLIADDTFLFDYSLSSYTRQRNVNRVMANSVPPSRISS
jgi:hypothetical protein